MKHLQLPATAALLLFSCLFAVACLSTTGQERDLQFPLDVSQPAEPATIDTNSAVYNALPFDEADPQDFVDANLGLIFQPPTVKIPARTDPCYQAPAPCDPNPKTVVWELETYKSFINTAPPVNGSDQLAPETVNPSLWRNAQLNMIYGLFRVTGDGGIANSIQSNGSNPAENLALAQSDIHGIYQVRAYDLSNITFVKGDSGWIVFDPLISPETADYALQLINDQIRPNSPLPVVAVIYSHSHIDHYGGAPGLFGYNSTATPPSYILPANDVSFFAPEGFTEHAVSENVTAGNAMGRRAIFMYGSLLERSATGSVNGGLGQTTSAGLGGLILPTQIVLEDDATIVDNSDNDTPGKPLQPSTENHGGAPVYVIDGVKMAFQMTPGTEAPAEMNTFLPQLNALWMAENTTNTLHNILTLRGAQVRDAYKWSDFLSNTIETFSEGAEVKFQSHHWPVWGATEIGSYLKKQRDIYKFIHDQTVRLMNNGYTGEEISELIEDLLPQTLNDNWATRGYYGTLRHNSRAVYQFYMGWYDGHPSDLNNLPPVVVARKYMEYLNDTSGNTFLKLAQNDFDEGEYRWVAEVMKHAVFANPEDTDAKILLAKALEQLGYQAESGPWRAVYLQAAYELRNEIDFSNALKTITPDTLRAMEPEMAFDFIAVHLCPERGPTPGSTLPVGGCTSGLNFECSEGVENQCTDGAAGKTLRMNVTISDLGSDGKYTLTVENAVMNYSKGLSTGADVDLTATDMGAFFEYLSGVQDGSVTIGPGQEVALNTFKSILDLDDEYGFNIVTP